MRSRTLTAEESRVAGILRDDWRNLFRCTSIDQALERVGLPFSHERRMRIAEHLLSDAEAVRLMRWAPATYVLANEEKLLARSILRHHRECGRLPALDEISGPAGIDLEIQGAADAFSALLWLGFLGEGSHGYELASDHARFLTGLGFHFHEVVLSKRRERFNTNCALDFFIMTHGGTRKRFLEQLSKGDLRGLAQEGMTEKMIDAIRGTAASDASTLAETPFYGGEPAILNTACGWSDEPICVVMENGRLVEVMPEATRYLRGGG